MCLFYIETHPFDVMAAPVHLSVKCDGCHVKSIKGLRFKCGNCNNYNLCGICVNYEQLHDNAHVFLLIKQPLSHDLDSTPLLKYTLYPHPVKSIPSWDPMMKPTEKLCCFPSDRPLHQDDDCDQKQASIFRITSKPPIFGVTPEEKQPDAPLGNSFSF